MDERAAGGESSTAYGHLPTMARESYAALKKALKERFELDSRRNCTSVSSAQGREGPGWAEYADELRVLADKAFLELEQARERLALNQYLDNPQVAFIVNPKQPASLINAVRSTLEMESYISCPASAK